MKTQLLTADQAIGKTVSGLAARGEVAIIAFADDTFLHVRIRHVDDYDQRVNFSEDPVDPTDCDCKRALYNAGAISLDEARDIERDLEARAHAHREKCEREEYERLKAKYGQHKPDPTEQHHLAIERDY